MHTDKTMHLSTPCFKATSRMSLLSVVVIANTAVQLMHYLWGFLPFFFTTDRFMGRLRVRLMYSRAPGGQGSTYEILGLGIPCGGATCTLLSLAPILSSLSLKLPPTSCPYTFSVGARPKTLRASACVLCMSRHVPPGCVIEYAALLNHLAQAKRMHACVRPFDCAVVGLAAGMHGHARSAAADVIRAHARNDDTFRPVRASEAHADIVAASLLASWLC